MAFGDRRDGKRIRNIHGFQNILIDFKPNRCDSVVYMNVDIDMTNFVKYMRELKKEHKDLTFFHGLVQLMGKTVYSRPYLNRFIANSTMYEHNKVQLASTIKEEFSDGSVEALMVIDVEPDDTLLDISKKTHEKVDRIRHKQSSDIDGTADNNMSNDNLAKNDESTVKEENVNVFNINNDSSEKKQKSSEKKEIDILIQNFRLGKINDSEKSNEKIIQEKKEEIKDEHIFLNKTITAGALMITRMIII